MDTTITKSPSKSTSSSSSTTPSQNDNNVSTSNPSGTTSGNNTKIPSKQIAGRSPSEPTSPTSLTLSRRDSSSTADISSDILQADEEQARFVHKHKLPEGWTCKYDSATDQYKFDLIQRQSTNGPEASREPMDGTSPTADHLVQTSRRPTFHLFECQYGYHFPTSPTSSMISELARMVQKSSVPPGQASSSPSKQPQQQPSQQQQQATIDSSRPRLIGRKLVVPSKEEEQLGRLKEMFPTAIEPMIQQMIRIYHGREGLIKAALISLGYKRSNEYDTRQATAQSPIMLMMSKPSSKKLYDKLVGYFPDKDENLIKTLMYKHKEVEHEIISALVESGTYGDREVAMGTCRDQTTRQSDKVLSRSIDENGAIMKLRYLKCLYPTCEEIELYHLLHSTDLNAQRVMELVEERGHKRANIEEVLKNRKSQTQQMRAQQAAHAAQDKKTTSGFQDVVEAHKKRVKPPVADARLHNLLDNLRKNLTDSNYEDQLLALALETSDYNEGLAKRFIEEMEPIDENLYKQRYKLREQEPPNYVAFPCKATQEDGSNFMSIVSNEFVHIPKEVIECNHALALLKVDASTFTGDDFVKTKFTHRQQDHQTLASGSKFVSLIKEKTKLRQMIRMESPHVSSKQGSRYEEIRVCRNDRPKSLAEGRNKSIALGSNPSLITGHNPELLKRVHPLLKAR